METISDKELMKSVAARDTQAAQALKILYRRYEKKIFNFILRYTGSREIAREIIQETFTRAWFSAHTFDREGGNFKGWVYTIALNLTRNEMSKKEYSYQYIDAEENRDWRQEAAAGTEVADRGPEAVLEKKELKDAVVQAIGKLKPFLREVIIMKNYQHLKFREIAEITKIPEGTLKARYHRAVELLRKHLQPLEVSHG